MFIKTNKYIKNQNTFIIVWGTFLFFIIVILNNGYTEMNHAFLQSTSSWHYWPVSTVCNVEVVCCLSNWFIIFHTTERARAFTFWNLHFCIITVNIIKNFKYIIEYQLEECYIRYLDLIWRDLLVSTYWYLFQIPWLWFTKIKSNVLCILWFFSLI